MFGWVLKLFFWSDPGMDDFGFKAGLTSDPDEPAALAHAPFIASHRVPTEGYLSSWALGWHYGGPLVVLGRAPPGSGATRGPL